MNPPFKIDHRIKKILIPQIDINREISNLANHLNKEYAHKKPILIGILKGCLPFYNELFLQLTCDPIMDFMVVSSYQGNVRAKHSPKIVTDLRQDIRGRHVIIVEDIIDSGKTLLNIKEVLKLRKPKSIKIICLVDKPQCRTVNCKADHVCFKVGPVFIVGYGLDYQEYFRNLPYIGELKETVYKKHK
ncbi:hypoxanthine-guanine phosphoribosyltransferase [Bacilli bacterium]|nr:hypoxanthine-guanine phosphoribosyltransferase [Bacilli bacterium]